MRRPVIIDCDPGHDDAIALLLALDFYGITGKAPNVDVGLDIDRDRFVHMLFEAMKRYA